jgi:hypothetical protein
MRRPIFGNGLPRNILTASGTVEVLNTADLNPGSVYALTLYLWIYQPGATFLTLNPTFNVYVTTAGGAPLRLLTYTQQYLDTIFSAPPGGAVAPIKVLDRYMVRGDQQVTVDNVNATSDLCVVWGYVEMVGEQDVGTPFRGLQPSNTLVAPFVFPPVAFDFVIANQLAITPLHRLSLEYVDLVTVDVANGGIDDGSFDFGCALAFPGGVAVPMPSTAFLAPNLGSGMQRSRVFDGIPMRALDSSDAGSNILFGGGTGSSAGVSNAGRAFGSFLRY